MSGLVLEHAVDYEGILRAISDLAPNLHNQDLNSEVALRSFARKYSSCGCAVVATIEDETVGFCAYYANDIVTRRGYLSMIVVSRSVRGQGVGSRLMEAMIADCKSKGMRSVCLEVADDNPVAIEFYLNRGFRKARRLSGTTCLYARGIEA